MKYFILNPKNCTMFEAFPLQETNVQKALDIFASFCHLNPHNIGQMPNHMRPVTQNSLKMTMWSSLSRLIHS